MTPEVVTVIRLVPKLTSPTTRRCPMRKAAFVRRSEEQRAELNRQLECDALNGRPRRRLQMLLLSDQGQTDDQLAQATGASSSTVERLRKRLAHEGLAAALAEKSRRGAPPKWDGKQQALSVALACSDAPAGCAKWSARVRANRAVEMEIVATLSASTVRRLLKKNALKPWQKRSWCIPKVSGAFVARMEDVLALYAEPLDASRPVVCRDELSKELHGPVAEPVPAQPGQTAKEDDAYQRHGTANVCLLLGPLLGWRHLEVTAKRGYKEFAQLRKTLVDDDFPKAAVIRVVLDNLNTQGLGALYETFPPEAARRSARKREFPYTPKQGSWLNRAEREFRVLRRQCLDRRIAEAAELAAEIASWEDPRNQAQTKIDWTFRVADARKKLHWIYPS